MRNMIIAGIIALLSCSFELGGNICLSLWTGDSVFKTSSHASDEEKQNAMEKYLGIFSGLGALDSENVYLHST